MAKEKFCINREQKLQTHGRGAKTLAQSMRHLDKHEKCADISHPELSHLNREYVKEPLTFKKVAKRLDELREEYNKTIDEYNVDEVQAH